MAIKVRGEGSKEIFDAIVQLKNNGFLSDELNVISADKDRIVTNSGVYELSIGYFGDEEANITMNTDGASWFGGLRGDVDVDDDNAKWRKFVANVTEYYHKNYSFLEFVQNKDADDSNSEKVVGNLFGLLKKISNRVALSPPRKNSQASLEDIYGLSLKLDITAGGAGEPTPVLCKVYFRSDGTNYTPMYKEEAGILESIVGSVPDDDSDDSDTLTKEHEKIIVNVFRAFENKCIKPSHDLDNDFTDYVVLSGAKDENIIGDMITKKTNNDSKTLRCSRIKVLGISHVRWSKAVYTVRSADKDLFSVTVNPNGSLDVFCLNCGGKPLIVGNCVKGGNWRIDPTKSDCGLTDTQVDEIRQNSEFAEHLFTVDTCRNRTNDPCSRTVCKSQVFFDVNGKAICKNCNHPEIVYTDLFNAAFPPTSTAQLNFAFDRMSMVDDKVFECRCCHKTYVKKGRLSTICDYCADSEDTAEDFKRYKYYSRLLSPLTRLTHLFAKRKSCKENKSLLIFYLGKDVYVFDRLKATDHRLIHGPVKYKRSKR